jgi:hypothetical protein
MIVSCEQEVRTSDIMAPPIKLTRLNVASKFLNRQVETTALTINLLA